jgi:outer membrane lipoprotein-sorting protein
MRRLRTLSTPRLYGFFAAVTVLLVGAGIAQASLGGPSEPQPKPLDRAVLDALRAPKIDGVSARVKFTNGLLPGGSLPNGAGGPLAAGAEGRLWIAGDGRFRLELQSDRGDAQIVDDGKRLTLYDPGSKTAYTAPSHVRHEAANHDDQRPTLAGVDRALGRLGQDWTLSGARPGTTGNRPSYTLRIGPKDDGGLLGAAEIAWDAAHGVPLRAAVYAQGDDQPVLELEATDVQFGSLPAAALTADPPRAAKVVELDPPAAGNSAGHPVRVRGAAAVQRRLAFRLAAPTELAGLPRTSVRLVRMDGANGALSTYGDGMGAIVVLQRPATAGDRGGIGELRLPQVNIDGATGTELATPLGTVLTFARGGVSYTVAGSVPPVAAENAARGLR